MYCKNCGRHLKEGTRFCDRCGQSVRKSSNSGTVTKRQEIEELKAERLNRKKRLAEKEAKQAAVKKRKKKKGGAVRLVFILLILAALSIIIGYILMSPKGSGGLAPSPAQLSGTAAPAASMAPVAASPAAQGVKSGYTSITVSGITCPYPSTFHSGTVTGNQKLSITDALGGASMTITQEGKSGSVNDLMREYAREKGGEISYSRAGTDWYAVTAQSQGNVYHRKCILRNGIAVYYDFTYSASSASSQKYNECIEYIDANFK